MRSSPFGPDRGAGQRYAVLRRLRTARVLVAAFAVAGSAGLALSATSAGAAAGSSQGVTATTISLGLDVAQSGQAAPETVPFVQGIQTFWDRQNALGGVCKRKVKFVFGDNGGDPQTELTAYTSMQNKILAMQQISPSAGLAGVVPQLEKAKILFSSSSTVNLFSVPEYYAIGTDFGHGVVDAVDFLLQHHRIAKGDTLGILYGTGPYATEADLGAQFAAKTYGLKLVQQQLAATDTDMSGAVSAFKSAGAKDVVMVALAPQDFDALSAMEAAGYHPPVIAASFLASALGTSAGPAMKSNKFWIMGNGGNISTANLSDSKPGVKAANTAYKKYFHAKATNPAIVFGYAQAAALYQVIKTSCANGQTPTRAGLLKAKDSITKLQTQGLLPPMNLSLHKANVPPTTEIYLSKVDTGVLGSLKTVTPYFAAPAAAKLNLKGN